jgi:prolyl 4-hydroxylase
MERAASFQGIPTGRLEPLQVVRYPLNGYFKHHYDWFSQDESNSAESCVGDYYCDQMGNRESTFFVYLTGEEEGVGGGETEFPYLEVPESINKKWCEFLDCDAGRIEKGVNESELNGGVRWKPKAGNAVFWENLDGDGRGIEEVLHAGLSVTGGTKIGMNIWTREQEIRVVEFCGM